MSCTRRQAFPCSGGVVTEAPASSLDVDGAAPLRAKLWRQPQSSTSEGTGPCDACRCYSPRSRFPLLFRRSLVLALAIRPLVSRPMATHAQFNDPATHNLPVSERSGNGAGTTRERHGNNAGTTRNDAEFSAHWGLNRSAAPRCAAQAFSSLESAARARPPSCHPPPPFLSSFPFLDQSRRYIAAMGSPQRKLGKEAGWTGEEVGRARALRDIQFRVWKHKRVRVCRRNAARH